MKLYTRISLALNIMLTLFEGRMNKIDRFLFYDQFVFLIIFGTLEPISSATAPSSDANAGLYLLNNKQATS